MYNKCNYAIIMYSTTEVVLGAYFSNTQMCKGESNENFKTLKP